MLIVKIFLRLPIMRKLFICLLLIGTLQSHIFAQDDLILQFVNSKLDSAFKIASDDFKKGLNIANQGLEIAYKNKRKDLIYKSLRAVGNIYEDKGQLENAKSNYAMALSLAESMPLESKYLYVYSDWAILHKKMGQYAIAQEYHQKTIDKAISINDWEMVEEGYHGLGTMYSMLSQFDKAIQYYFKSINAAEKWGNKEGVVLTRQNISSIFRKAKNYEMARKSIIETYDMAIALKDSLRIASVLMVYGEIESDAKVFDIALGKLEKAKEIFTQKKAFAKQCQAMIAIGKIYFEQGNYNAAEATWKACLSRENYILPYEFANLYNKLGNLFYQKGNYNAAIQAIEKSLEKTNMLGYKEIALENQRLLADIYEKQGNLNLAVIAHKSASVLNDSLVKVNQQRQMTDAQFLFDVERRDLQILMQQKDLQYNKYIAWGLSFAVLLLSSLLFVTWKQMKAKQKAQKKAELLLSELNHRVKNNLQTITSIMRLQSRQVEDQNVRALFNESRQRLEAMTMLHHQFYKDDDIETIDLQNFTNQLVPKLCFAYNFEKANFVADILIENNPINAITAQPIALIINELVTNSFKHAFKNTSNPSIKIHLTDDQFIYTDNGCGLGKDYNHKKDNGLGLELISSLVEQLNARLKFISSNEGLLVEIKFSIKIS